MSGKDDLFLAGSAAVYRRLLDVALDGLKLTPLPSELSKAHQRIGELEKLAAGAFDFVRMFCKRRKEERLMWSVFAERKAAFCSNPTPENEQAMLSPARTLGYMGVPLDLLFSDPSMAQRGGVPVAIDRPKAPMDENSPELFVANERKAWAMLVAANYDLGQYDGSDGYGYDEKDAPIRKTIDEAKETLRAMVPEFEALIVNAEEEYDVKRKAR